MASLDLLASFLGVRVSKALDPNNPRDLEKIMAQLGKELGKVSAPLDEKSIQEALDVLDVDWSKLSAAQREQVFVSAQSRLVLVPLQGGLLPRVQFTLLASALETMGATRKGAAAKHGFKVGLDVTSGDSRAAIQASRLQASFIRDQYGKRSVALSQTARDVVSDGLEQGWGRQLIGDKLAERMSAQGVARSQSYWDIVAAAQTNNARMLSSLRMYADNDVETYTFQAVMDELTSDVCRLMDGKTFSVARGLATAEAAMTAATPDDVKASKPWLAMGKDDDGQPVVYYKDRGGQRVPVADVEESAVGRVDTRGKFKQRVDDDALQAAGVTVPPLHGYCRSGIYPDV
jgi:hypothetical protein